MSKHDKTFHGVAAAALVCALAFVAVFVPAVYGAEPINTIVSIDAVKGLVTVKDRTTRRTTQVEVTDKALLKSLRVGQPVTLDPAKSINGITPVDPNWNLQDAEAK
jgi:hypothetical protein